MGFNTTLLIRNDALAHIESNPEEFVKNLSNAMATLGYQKGSMNGNIPCGSHCNAAQVITNTHADLTHIIAAGENYASVLGTVSAGNKGHHEPEQQIEILKQLAEQLGYKLSKKGK